MYWSNQIEVQRREVAAWVTEKKGSTSDAIALMRSAAELEESMDKHAVTPGAIIPAREMLAELLLLHHRADESLAEYQAALQIAPNRFNALYGAANAAEASGNAALANQYFRKLIEIAVGDERPELVAARKKVASTERSSVQ
jgi:tetratricopeptide (TPR) repeat protein